jgi:hypothetical protein
LLILRGRVRRQVFDLFSSTERASAEFRSASFDYREIHAPLARGSYKMIQSPVQSCAKPRSCDAPKWHFERGRLTKATHRFTFCSQKSSQMGKPMPRKSPNLTVSLPSCRNCKRHWRPAKGVVALASYCKKCATDRRTTASSAFGLRPIDPADLTGAFLLPRKLRPR